MHQKDFNQDSLQDLASRFCFLAENDASWEEVWQLLIQHAWFQAKLLRVTKRELKKRRLPGEWLDDVVQGAMVELALSMQRQQGLRFDPARGSFRGFLSVVAVRSCQKSLRQFRRRLPPQPGSDDAVRRWSDQQLQEELRTHVNELTGPPGIAARLFCQGFSVEEIAQQMNCSKRTTWRNLQMARQALRDSILPDRKT